MLSVVIIFILAADSFYFLRLNFRLVLVFSVFYFLFSFPLQSVPNVVIGIQILGDACRT